MNEHMHEQLDKILALADSIHDGEAVVAVRKARQILTRDGLSFGDLARAAYGRTPSKSSSLFSFLSGQHEQLESQVQHLRQQLEDLQAQMQTQDLQLDFWRRRATDLEQNTTAAQLEAERWKKLACETMERLRETNQNIEGEDIILAAPFEELNVEKK